MTQYRMARKDRTGISELALQDSGDVQRVIKAYFEEFSVERITVTLPEYEIGLHKEFSAFAESYEVTPADMFRIFDFANVIEAFLTLKYQTVGISQGQFSAVVEDQPLTITVDSLGVHVDRQALPGAVRLERMEAQKLILTPYGRYMDIEVPGDWFPLPLFWYAVDSF